MENYLSDFNIVPKNPSEEALRRWRSAVSLVKNRRRRFRVVADLPERSENEKKVREIQQQIQVRYTSDFQSPPVDSLSASLLQKTEHSIDIERNDHGKGNSERCSKATIERIFVITNFMLEVISAALDQLSSPRKTYFALLAMLTSFVGIFICISQLIYKGREEKVTWRRKNNVFWFYSPSPSNKRLGTFTDIIGLVCGIFQSIFTTIAYSYLCRHANNPIKISIWPIIFAFGLLCSNVFKNSESSTLPMRED